MQIFLKSCNVNFSTCFKMCSIRGFWSCGKKFFFFNRGVESIAISSLIRIVPRSTTRSAVYQRSNLLKLIDGTTSSRVATDYHLLAYLYFNPWWKVSLCGLEVKYSRHKSSKGNVLCFGKSQQSLGFLVVDWHWKYGV